MFSAYPTLPRSLKRTIFPVVGGPPLRHNSRDRKRIVYVFFIVPSRSSSSSSPKTTVFRNASIIHLVSHVESASAIMDEWHSTLASYTAPAANAHSRRKEIDSWTKIDTTSCQSPVTSLKRIRPMEPDMEQLYGTVQYYFGKVVQRRSLPRFFVWNWVEWRNYYGLRPWPLLHCDETGKKSEREIMETLIKRRSAMTLKMQKTVPWSYSNYWILKQVNSSTATSPTKAQPADRRPRRIFLQTWFICMEIWCSRDNAFVSGTGTLHHGVNNDFFILPDETFCLPEISSPGNRRWCDKCTYRAHVFLMRTLSQLVVTVVLRLQSSRHAYWLHANGWLKHNMKLCVLCVIQKCSRHRAPCHMSHPWWAAHLQLAHALLPSQWHVPPLLLHFPVILLSARFKPAPVYVNPNVYRSKVRQDQIGHSKIRQKQHVEAIAEPWTDKKIKRTGGRVNDPTACGCYEGTGKGDDLRRDREMQEFVRILMSSSAANPSQQVSLYFWPPHLQQESLLTFQLRICWVRSRSEDKKQLCHEIRTRSWSPHRNVLDGNRPAPPGLDRSSCFRGSALSPGMIHHFEAKYTLDMIPSVCQVDHHQV